MMDELPIVTQEALDEALFGLSARLLLSGFLDDADNHAAYEKVVAANAKHRIASNTEAATLIEEMASILRTASWLLADISPDGLVKAKVDAAIAKATQ